MIHRDKPSRPQVRARKPIARPSSSKNHPKPSISTAASFLSNFPVLYQAYQFIQNTLDTFKAIAVSPTTWRTLIRSSFFVFVAAFLYGTAWFAYIGFYTVFIPKLSTSTPVYFNFGANQPTATLSTLANDKSEFFQYSQPYDLILDLEVPESEANLALGNFMVKLELQNRGGTALYSVERPAILTYRSDLLRRISTLFYGLPLIIDWLNQKQKLSILLAEGFWDDYDDIIYTVFLSISKPTIQIYKSMLRVEVKLSGLKYLMYHWPTSTAVIFTTFFFFGELLFALASWQGMLYLWNRLQPSESSPQTVDRPTQRRETPLVSSSVSSLASSSTTRPNPAAVLPAPRAHTPTNLGSVTEEEEWERLSATQVSSTGTPNALHPRASDTNASTAVNPGVTHEDIPEIPDDLRLEREETDRLFSSYFGRVHSPEESQDEGTSQTQSYRITETGDDVTVSTDLEISEPPATSSSRRYPRAMDPDQRSATLIGFDEEVLRPGYSNPDGLPTPKDTPVRRRVNPKKGE